MENSIKIYVDNLPRRSIIMWYGEKAAIPEGWALCDGNNGTPDLRGRFVVGAASDPTLQPGPDEDNLLDSKLTNYELGDNGGYERVRLQVSEMPQHSHRIVGNTESDGNHEHSWRGYYKRSHSSNGEDCRSRKEVKGDPEEKVTRKDGAHSHELDFNSHTSGGNNAHENRPPFCALYYIMKIR